MPDNSHTQGRSRKATPCAVILAAALFLVHILHPHPGHADDAPLSWEARVEVASGDAFRGPWRMNESDFRFVDDPSVAINDEGVVAVAWADQARQDIFIQLYDPDGETLLPEPANVSRSTGIFSWLPRVVLTDGENPHLYVLWQDIVFSGGSHGGEIFFARSTDGGRSFSEPVNLSNTTAGAGKGRLTRNYWHNGSLDLANGPNGHVYVAWTEYEGVLWFSRSTDAGQSFADPVRIAGESGALPARGPSLAVSGDRIYLAWTVGEDPSADIHITLSPDAGETFESSRAVAAGSGHADAPKLAVDTDGIVHLVYAESPDGPAGPYRIHYTQADAGTLGFTEPIVIARPRAGDAAMVHFPHLAVDGAGRLFVLWERFPDPRRRPLGLGYAWSDDGGASFAQPRVLEGTDDPRLGANGSQQGLLMQKLAVNARGRIAVVNSNFMPGQTSHVWLIMGQYTESR